MAVAADHDGVAAREQLLAAGLTRHEIERRTADGRLQMLYPGVYAVGHRALGPRGWRRAAILAGGPDSVISHATAAWDWRLVERGAVPIHVTIRGDRGRTVPGIATHRCRLDAEDVTVLDGLAIVTPMRALLDLAESEPQRSVDRALDAAVRLRLYDERAMAGVLARGHGRHGLKRLRRGLAKLTSDAGRGWSELELLMHELIRDHGIPRPEINAPVLAYHADLLWRRQRVVVELDSRTFHLTPLAFEDDRERDGELQAAGYIVQRFTHRQVTERPHWVATTLRALLDRRMGISTA